MVDINRRGLITGLISLAAAPAIVRASSLMPVKMLREEIYIEILPPISFKNFIQAMSIAQNEMMNATGSHWRIKW